MRQSSVQELLQSLASGGDLRRIAIPGVDASQWMPAAVRMTAREAIEHLLAELPRQAPVEVVELVNGDLANRIRRTHAARAVLMAFIAGADDPLERYQG